MTSLTNLPHSLKPFTTLLICAVVFFVFLLACQRERKHFRSDPIGTVIPGFLLTDSIAIDELYGTWGYTGSNCLNQFNYLPCDYCFGNLENSESVLKIDTNFMSLYGYPLERYYQHQFELTGNQIAFMIDSVDLQDRSVPANPEYNGSYVYLRNDTLFLIEIGLGRIFYDQFVQKSYNNDSLAYLDEVICDWSRLQTTWHFPPDIVPPVPLECDHSKLLPDTLKLLAENAENFSVRHRKLQYMKDNDTIHFEFFKYRGKVLYLHYVCGNGNYLIHYSRD